MNSISQGDIQRLIDAATEARQHAYSPYSQHKVGAAVVDAEGMVHAGPNIEMVTLQQSVHAERTAILKMVGTGARQLRAVCVVGPYSGVPCAECRQAIWEFCCGDAGVVVVSAPTDGEVELMSMGDIYPRPYGPETKGFDPRKF